MGTFEQSFQDFIRGTAFDRAFDRPCIREDLERASMQADQALTEARRMRGNDADHSVFTTEGGAWNESADVPAKED